MLLIMILCLSALTVAAQNQPPQVTASFDCDSILIGDQFHLDIRVDKDMMQIVDFPVFGDQEIAPGVEILAEYPVDTVSTDGRRQILLKRYLMTIFNEGDYNIGRASVLYADKNIVDTLFSRDSLKIRVATFNIDLQKDQPFDIKLPRGVKLKFGEIGGWFALCVGCLAIIVLLIWLFVKYRKRIPFLGGEKPKIPPHLMAIRKLEALKNQKLPQNGKVKQYYTGITDIIREYLNGRFGISALEMTSDEIIDATAEYHKEGVIDDKRYQDLQDLLRTADLVKFAKFAPDDEYNESAYYDAYYFVEETKLIEVEGKPEETEDDL